MSAGSSTTTNTAGTKGTKARGGAQLLVGQTFRKLKLTAGERPFAVVSVDTEADTASGWLMLDPVADGQDQLLKELGVQSADRLRPCYITVRTDLVR